MPANSDHPLWAATIWLAIVLLAAGAVISIIAGTWSTVVLAAAGIALCALLLVMRHARIRR